MAEFERWKFPKRRPVGFNYYRDLFLMGPFLLFSIVALILAFQAPSAENRRDFFSFVIAAGICILLAKEKLLLVLGTLAFVLVRLFAAMPAATTWHPLALFFACLGLGVLLLAWVSRTGYEPSYNIPDGYSLSEFFVALLGFGTALLVGYWIRY